MVEGDEYDTAFFDKGPKFYHYQPHIAAITSLEFDHADIYPDLASIEAHFARFSTLLPAAGTLFYCSHYANIEALTRDCRARRIAYGLSGHEDITAREISTGSTGTTFELVCGGTSHGRWHSPLSGDHNLLNALVAIGIARTIGIADARIKDGLAQFQNVKRRQEVRGTVGGITVIDDFAHHPTAVRETIRAVRARYPGSRLWAVFEPRSNSAMRKIFQQGFAESLAEADRICIAPVFRPEKVPDGQVLDTVELARAINRESARAATYGRIDDIVTAIQSGAKSGDVILVMSNGGFDNIHDKLLNAL